jgi:flagellar biosynthesis/type III secretory pathway chaperone
MDDLLQRLAGALAEERRALIEHDVAGLVAATRDKLEVLHALQLEQPVGQQARLRELARANRANGVLLARRRREVNWALCHLGRSERAPAYDASGQSSTLQASRMIAVA